MEPTLYATSVDASSPTTSIALCFLIAQSEFDSHSRNSSYATNSKEVRLTTFTPATQTGYSVYGPHSVSTVSGLGLVRSPDAAFIVGQKEMDIGSLPSQPDATTQHYASAECQV